MQSNEDQEKEKSEVETLINQNVACIMISLATGTENTNHLKKIARHQIPLIQFDRVDEKM